MTRCQSTTSRSGRAAKRAPRRLGSYGGQPENVSQGRFSLQHVGLGGDQAGAKIGKRQPGLCDVAAVGLADLSSCRGEIVGELRLFHLPLAGPHIGPREDQVPIGLDDAADHFLNGVLELKIGSLGVDPRNHDRRQVGRRSAALQQRLSETEIERRAILRIERKNAGPKSRLDRVARQRRADHL